MARVYAVLVRPETPRNVGAAARIVRNTGLAGLRLVAPGDWRTVTAWRSAWGAHEVLETAAEFADLAAAVADAHDVTAFAGRPPSGVAPEDPRDTAARVAGLPADAVACLVFGPEATGLRHDEIAWCGSRATIPSHPDQPSLNLSHAVMVAAYEVFRARPPLAPPPPRAPHSDKAVLLRLLRTGLDAIGALPRVDADRHFVEWTDLLQRCDLSAREMRLLEHAARRMAKAGPDGNVRRSEES